MTERKYLPTFAELVDRLSIVLLKSIFIPENREAYLAERDLIEHDMQLFLVQRTATFTAEEIRAVLVVMLANHAIWINESEARKGLPGSDVLLKFTHSINGCRNTAKNVLAVGSGDSRVDKKIDCLAADLPSEFGNWKLF